MKTAIVSDNRLEARELQCIRDDRVLFENLSFDVCSAQVLLLEGANGCGKTSLLRILCGIRMQDQGDVAWNGENIDKLGSNYYGIMAYVGHMDGVKRELTVEENLNMARALGSKTAITSAQALEQVDLAGYQPVRTQGLSAGQKRRLALARLLVTENALWVLDEPFTALDQNGILRVEHLIQAHTHKGGMVVMTSHHQVHLNDVEVIQINLSS